MQRFIIEKHEYSFFSLWLYDNCVIMSRGSLGQVVAAYDHVTQRSNLGHESTGHSIGTLARPNFRHEQGECSL